jgi:hypothetical protein
VQTDYNIYISCNETGNYETVTNYGVLKSILMIRGYNSHFYYVKKAGDTDEAVFSFKP